MEHMKKHGLT